MSDPLMSRPVMDPLFLEQLKNEPKFCRRAWVLLLARAMRWIAGKLLSHPLSFRRLKAGESTTQEPLRWRLVRGLGYRMLFTPIVLALIAGTLVFRGTHPQVAVASGDPNSFGVHFDVIHFPSDHDGVELTGWLMPAVDARRVLLHRERLLAQRQPAVLLVHDHGQSPHQLLPLVAPMHEDGLVVLAIALRGQGTGEVRASTFGLHEAGDVRAAINLLKNTPFVDPQRIAVVGIGTGANAAMLAARDTELAGIVLADPVQTADEVVAKNLGPGAFGVRWMQPLAKWAFEIAYRQDIDEIGMDQQQSVLAGRKVLVVTGATVENRLIADPAEKIRTFCRETLRPWK